MTVTRPDPRRATAHAMWASVAPGWARYADDADARGSGIAGRMVDAAALAPGDRVLELACGPGGLGMLAAARVLPGGRVVVSDVVAPMVDIAVARAGDAGLTNVSGAVLDLEDVDAPDGSFDAVLCREGLMFALDHARAVAEIARVLRPGGRVAVAVWGPRDANPWLGVVLDTLGAVVGMELPPPGIPGPFALGDADDLTSLFATAPFTDVRVDEMAVPMNASSYEEWSTRTFALAGPVSNIVGGLDDTRRAAFDADLRAAVAPYLHDGRIDLPGRANVLTATRA